MNIIDKIKSGDLSELDKVYLEVKPKFIAFASKQFPGINMEIILDIYQDTIIVFYHNIQRGILSEIKSSLSAYIIQIGKVKLIQHIDNVKKDWEMKGLFIDNAIAHEDYNYKIDQAVKFIFSKMTDACKQILQLFYYEKKSMDEIALMLNYKNADTVKSKKSRCISTFNSNVNKLYFDED